MLYLFRYMSAVLEVVQRVQTPAWRVALVALVATGVVVLFLGTVVAWRLRVVAAFPRPDPSRVALTAGTMALVAIAAVLAGRGGDPWQLFTWGLGLAAAAVVAPRLAAAGPRGEAVGVAVGVAVFAATLFAGAWMIPVPDVSLQQPALIAAPLAWLAARLGRSRV